MKRQILICILALTPISLFANDDITGANQGSGNVPKLTDNIETKITDIKDLLEPHNTPVGIKADFAIGAGFEFLLNNVHYIKDVDNQSCVSIDLKANFTLPFSVSGGTAGNSTITFAGENVVLRGKGSSKIYVVPTDNEKLEYCKYPLCEEKVDLYVHKDSYVEVDCEGFKHMRLKGFFEFSSELVYPSDVVTDGTNSDETRKLQASFDTEITNLDDIIISAQLNDPFKVKVTGDIVYTVTGMTADLSTARNAENFQTPDGYNFPLPDCKECWTGFAMSALKVDLSQEFSGLPFKECDIETLLIDETGVSGWVKVSKGKYSTNNPNLTSEDKKELNSDYNLIDGRFLALGIDELSLGFCSNKIIGGGMNGNVSIKALLDDDNKPLNLAWNGKFFTMSETKEMGCNLKATMPTNNSYTFPFLKGTAKIRINADSYFAYEKNSEDKGFTFNFNGGVDFKSGILKFKGINFEGLRISSIAPNFSVKKFGLVGSEPFHLGGLTFTLKKLEGGMDSDNKSALLSTDMKLELIEKRKSSGGDDNGAAIDGAFTLTANTEGESGHWEIGGLQIDSLAAHFNYSAFRFDGLIGMFKDDEKYGNGFRGSLSLTLKPLELGISARAYFGHTTDKVRNKDFRYWYAYAGIEEMPSEVPVMLFPSAVFLRSVSFAAYSRMNFKSDNSLYKLNNDYEPDYSVKFGFQGGLGAYVANKNLINAKAFLEMQFDEDGGFNSIGLRGIASALSKNPSDAFINGAINSTYNFQEHIFDLVSDMNFTSKFIKGHVPFDLHTERNKWHLHIGTCENPVKLEFADLCTAKCYLMFGEVPSSLPPLNKTIINMFGVINSESASPENRKSINDGKGFAFGADLSISGGPSAFIYADVKLKGGTDALIARRDYYQCDESDYRGSGRTYLYLDLGAGVELWGNEFEFFGVEAASVLSAEFPAPYYVSGEFGFKYRLLAGRIRGSADAYFNFGKHCNWELTEEGKKHMEEEEQRKKMEEEQRQQETLQQSLNQSSENTPNN